MTSNIAILMCTYNGDKFLKEQLDSFASQSYKDHHLFVYDDHSTDKTEELVAEYKKHNKATWCRNQVQLGCCKNFLNSLVATPDNFEFYSLADQDDIWLENKLSRAIEYLKNVPEGVPALYGSMSIITDNQGNRTGLSPLFAKLPSFKNALVQSIAGGNTMVFNKAARDIIAKAVMDVDVFSHDWFIYQLISGVGGKIYYDLEPEILYRQHGGNLTGSNNGFFARLSRAKSFLSGSFKGWNDRNLKALEKSVNLLTEENKKTFNIFKRARKRSMLFRLWEFFRSGIYRQTFVDNIALFVGAILNKI
ncbi:glycosyltransferase family 2 protein [Rickettsiaceae bacterium]|nr:glycosyltransferase family 2 protein [Rickettsiaceae bacterium]